MNWVSPIKDEETLERFKQELRKVDDKYYILFEIGVGTGLQLQEILKFKIRIFGAKKVLKPVSERRISSVRLISLRIFKRQFLNLRREKIRKRI